MVPKPIVLKTDRLNIRRVMFSDWKMIKEIWESQKLSEYACYDRFNNTSEEAVQERIQKWDSYTDSIEHMFFAVCLEEQLIGYITFHRHENGYEIGYCFHSNFHGRGYAKESLLALIHSIHERENIVRFIVGTAIANIPSTKLLYSVGFRQIGTEQVTFYKNSKGQDIYFEGGIFELDMNKSFIMENKCDC